MLKLMTMRIDGCETLRSMNELEIGMSTKDKSDESIIEQIRTKLGLTRQGNESNQKASDGIGITYNQEEKKRILNREIDSWSDTLKLLLDQAGPPPYSNSTLTKLTEHIQRILTTTLGPAGNPCSKCGGSGRANPEDTNP